MSVLRLRATEDSVFEVLFSVSFSGEMHELHAAGDPDGEAPRRLQRSGPVLLSGRTQVLHPLEAVAQKREGQE